jgi:hypothetical protein
MRYILRQVLIFVVVILALPGLVFSTGPDVLWTRTYGYRYQRERAHSIAPISSGGFILAGTKVAGEGSRFYLLKLDDEGDTLWTTRHGQLTEEYRAFGAKETRDGGFIAVGSAKGPLGSRSDLFLFKTNEWGLCEWARSFGDRAADEIGYDVVEAEDGGFLAAGHRSYGEGADAYLVRINAWGDTLWTRTYGGVGTQGARAIQPAHGGGYRVAGRTTRPGAHDLDGWVLTVSASGDSLSAIGFGGEGDDEVFSMAGTSGDGVIVAGRTGSGSRGTCDAWVVAFDSLGRHVRNEAFGGEGLDEFRSIRSVRGGGYIVTGYSNSPEEGDDDVLLLMLDESFDSLWTLVYREAGDQRGHAVAQAEDSGYIVAGTLDQHIYLLKTGPDRPME